MKISQYSHILLCALFAVAFSYIFVLREHNVYFWDARGYWIQFDESVKLLLNSPSDYFRFLRKSIKYSNYNASSVALLIPFGVLFGTSRAVYIIAISIAYFLPLCLIIAALMQRIAKETSKSDFKMWLWLSISITYPSLWFPIMRGAPDIIGLIPFGLIILIVIKTPTNKIKIGPFITVGVLLWLPFLFRRWYVYSIIALALTSPFLSIYVTKKYDSITKIVKYTILNYLLSALTLLLAIFLFQKNLIKEILSSQYSQEFVAYQTTNYAHVMNFIDYFGIINIIILMIAAVSCFFNKKTTPYILYGFSNLIITLFLFTRTQAFTNHHYLPIAFWCLYLACMTIIALSAQIKSIKIRSNVNIIVSCLFIAVFIISTYISWFAAKPFFGAVPSSAEPYRVANINNYYTLADQLKKITSSTDQASVFASNAVLNDSMLLSLTNEQLAGHLATVTQVDPRDGINIPSLLTRYVVVTNPTLTHLSSGQETIKLNNELILKGIGIGSAYQKISDEYILDGATAFIFEKKRKFSTQEADDYLNSIYEIYPNWKMKYSHKILSAVFASSATLGDTWGKAEFSLVNNSFFIHPGSIQPTVLKLPYNGLLSFSFSNPCLDADGVVIVVGDKNSQISKVFPPSINEVRIDTSHLDKETLFIAIYNNGTSTCDGVDMKLISVN